MSEADSEGRTALMIAAGGGFLSVVDLLLEAGAIVDTYDEDGQRLRTACAVSINKVSCDPSLRWRFSKIGKAAGGHSEGVYFLKISLHNFEKVV